ncbi:lipolytic protein G-D-S-L family [Methanosphaerula palustris E1-9c]|uniref:Lipolytic protein G-D-S-L family n=2 Tax=Methanosphaerula palustris TaxID=475088 RepID=B8GDR2_METPE|nr:lipolytic protein G-D-S-L family [Methanosphaerula palustris E1-9c]
METVKLGRLKIWAAMIILFCGVCIGLATPISATVQIYPLGDSITYGDVHDGQNFPSYRYWLWNDLKSKGFDVDFIGSQHGPDYGLVYDTDNDGHAGYTSARELAELPTWLPGLKPDIVLLHLGTNDVLEGVPQATTIGNIGAIITELRAVNPQVKIMLAEIIPTSVNKTNEQIVSLNTGFAGLQQQMSTDASPIILVDQYTGYDGEHDNQDGGVHPAETGEMKIAAKWSAALVSLLSQPTIQPTIAVTTVAPVVTTVAPVATQTTTTTSDDWSGFGKSFGSSSGFGSFGSSSSFQSGGNALGVVVSSSQSIIASIGSTWGGFGGRTTVF